MKKDPYFRGDDGDRPITLPCYACARGNTPRVRACAVIGLYVGRRHENCQFSRSTRLCVMYTARK